MDRLSIHAQTLYAELVEQLLARETRRSIGSAPGAFVTKEIKGKVYYYFQYVEPGSRVRQAYVGPKSEALDAVVRRFSTEKEELRADRQRTAELVAALRAAGAQTLDAASARVIAALADGGVFALGGVLVGTHAFLVAGNVLGVRWSGAAARTEDIDIGSLHKLEVAVPEVKADVPKILEALELGFLPVPALSPKEPSTSFKVRGRGLRVDLVTPARSGKVHGAVPIPRLGAAAAPVRFLDFALEDTQPAAVAFGDGILVTIPSPARLALHKLLVARDRPAAFAVKADKDLQQAALLVDVLDEDRPHDLDAAFAAAKRRGYERPLREGVALLKKRWPETFARLSRRLGRS